MRLPFAEIAVHVVASGLYHALQELCLLRAQPQSAPLTRIDWARPALQSASAAVRIPPGLALQVPGAFQLAASAVTLAGADLPAALPRRCAVPPAAALCGVLDDCEAAARAMARGAAPHAAQPLGCADVFSASQQAEATTPAAPRAARDTAHAHAQVVRAVRWAAKRVIRAAGEAVLRECNTYTRDLFWCCQLADEHLDSALSSVLSQHGQAMRGHVLCMMRQNGAGTAQDLAAAQRADELHVAARLLIEQLWAALDLYVQADGLQAAALHSGMRRMLLLAEALDAVALATMTAVPAGLFNAADGGSQAAAQNAALTTCAVTSRHVEGSVALGAPVNRKSSKRARSGLEVAHSWLSRLRQICSNAATAAAAAALAADFRLGSRLVVAVAPHHGNPLTAGVTEFDFQSAAGRAAAEAHFATLHRSPLAMAAAGPVVFRGGAAAWRACGRWTVQAIVRRAGGCRCRVRIAPGPEFPFVQPRHAEALATVAGSAAAAPSAVCEVRRPPYRHVRGRACI